MRGAVLSRCPSVPETSYSAEGLSGEFFLGADFCTEAGALRIEVHTLGTRSDWLGGGLPP